MFSQSVEQPAADQSPAPVGMRELPPQPAKPVMPAYTDAAQPEAPAGPGPDDSVIARDDHFEGTFTSRGTVVVMGSVKGRIEAVQVRIEDGATVDADVIVDEAIVAGEFTGNLTCRTRLEAHASGRINGRIETHKLMLHEGASVEGEMHMLTEAPKAASETIRGSAPLRGDNGSEAPAQAATRTDLRADTGPQPESDPAATRPAPSVRPASTVAKSPSPAVVPTATTSSSSALEAAPTAEVSSVLRRPTVAETLRAETLRVAPRTTSSVASYSGNMTTGSGASSSASRSRSGTTTGF